MSINVAGGIPSRKALAQRSKLEAWDQRLQSKQFVDSAPGADDRTAARNGRKTSLFLPLIDYFGLSFLWNYRMNVYRHDWVRILRNCSKPVYRDVLVRMINEYLWLRCNAWLACLFADPFQVSKLADLRRIETVLERQAYWNFMSSPILLLEISSMVIRELMSMGCFKSIRTSPMRLLR